MTPPPPLLDLHRVSFRYGHREILRDATFALHPGTATALIGPNGIGKTTLLRLASGVLKPSTGTIALDGRPLATLSARHAARQIAVVPQHLEVPFDYTVQQIVAQGRTPYLSPFAGHSAGDRREIDRALDLTDTAPLRHRVFNELSGGERQRVKIALGLAQQPRLLLLDEPTQNLDIGRQMELLHLLRHLRELGLTILAAIHDLHLIAGNFSAVILLRPAVPPLHGPPSRILEQSLIEAAFDCPSSDHPLFAHLAATRAPAPKHSEPLAGDPS